MLINLTLKKLRQFLFHSLCVDHKMAGVGFLSTQQHFSKVFQQKSKIKNIKGFLDIWVFGGDDARNFEPTVRLKFEDLDKSIQKLRDIYKIHPEWFEVPKPKSTKGKNEVDYSI